MSSPAAAPSQERTANLTPAIVILGADALLAARPATPGQLANACYAAGYSAVIPSSWGDELVAAGCLREIAARGQGSVVLCSCPRVAERMRRVTSLLPQLLPMASPPVAAARYLRARAGRHGVHITYVGDCPGGSDPAIDRHATPSALLRSLTKRGIKPEDQPTEVDERLLRDGRRFYSLPGGAPAPNWLYVEKRGYTLIEPTASDFLAEVAFRVSKKERRVVDLAPRLGCACSGVIVGQPWGEAREKVAASEPPRAVHEVLDHDVPLDLTSTLDPWTGSAPAGQATIPITLDALAGLYNPEQKSDPVRSLQPPPIPLPTRANGHCNGESEHASGPSVGPPPASQQPDLRALIKSLTRGPGESARPPALTPVEPTTRPIPDAPKEPTTLPIPEPRTAERYTHGLRVNERRTHDRPAKEPRTNERLASEPRTNERLTNEPRTGPVFGRRDAEMSWNAGEFDSGLGRRFAIFAGVLVFVGIAIVLAQRALATYSPQQTRTASRQTTVASPAPSATLASATAPALSGAPDALDTTRAAPLPADPDLPREPIGPVSGNPLVASPAGDPAIALGHFRANPAPVYSPGAAPIPRHAGRSASGMGQSVFPLVPAGAQQATNPNANPTDDLPPPLALRPASSPPTASEVLAIRAEIARRRHRVDSLRMVVDSLAARSTK